MYYFGTARFWWSNWQIDQGNDWTEDIRGWNEENAKEPRWYKEDSKDNIKKIEHGQGHCIKY